MNKYFIEFQKALLNLRQSLGFVSIVALILGLTIAALIAVFKLNYILFVKPLPYPEHQRLHVVKGLIYEGERFAFGYHSYPGVVKLYQENGMFDQASIIFSDNQRLTSDSSQPETKVSFVSPEIFSITGAQVALGRTFDETEALYTNQAVAVIGYDEWQSRYSGRNDILGEKISLNDTSYTIIGVLAKSFLEPEIWALGENTQVWIPWDNNPITEPRLSNWGGFSAYSLIGKLRQGLPPKDAEAQMSEFYNTHFKRNTSHIPFFNNYNARIKLTPLEDVIIGDSRNTSLLLLAGVLTLVLIAATNISNLFLSRVVHRQRKLAIQAALGANMKHLFRAFFAESFVVMSITWLASLLFSLVIITLLKDIAREHLPRMQELSLDLMSVLFGLLVTSLLAFIFTLLSVRTIKYRKLSSMLQSSGKGSGLQISKTTRNTLIASQVCMALLLLLINNQLFKQSTEIINKDLGFNSNSAHFLSLSTAGGELAEAENLQLSRQLMENLANLPEVESVTNTYSPPTRYTGRGIISIDKSFKTKYNPSIKRVDEKYLETIDLRLLQGRNFTAAEVSDNSNVMLLNQSLAETLFPDSDPVGNLIHTNRSDHPVRVIGVVKDIDLPHARFTIRAYMPRQQSTLNFMLKLRSGTSISAEELNRILGNTDKRLRVYNWQSMQDARTSLLRSDIVTASITATLALLSLLLACIGIYGVFSYNIQLREYELGVRMAIGASPKHILKLIFIDNSRPVLWGVAMASVLGLAIYLLAQDYVSQYFSFEWVTVALTLVITFIAISLASFLPLRSIISKQPISALRTESQ